ncbi:putative holin [Serratia liquefaciens]|uniref:Uncharacterized protein n=1 Tax=Serratia liquefaciens TaxID=614 RepID=A0A515D5M1_SERLI|nr:putative holin [Serratia liquefaciens]QDL35700.1 hypothetical protein EGO53_28310 [Serratia liquefaciens]
MFIVFFHRISESPVTASLSGAMIYTLAQSNFTGVSRVIAFFVSFCMGVAGADVTIFLLKEFLPYGIQEYRNAGAFICSALVVTLSVNVISYAEKNLMQGGGSGIKDEVDDG